MQDEENLAEMFFIHNLNISILYKFNMHARINRRILLH